MEKINIVRMNVRIEIFVCQFNSSTIKEECELFETLHLQVLIWTKVNSNDNQTFLAHAKFKNNSSTEI